VLVQQCLVRVLFAIRALADSRATEMTTSQG
jgi:hypothetical protein